MCTAYHLYEDMKFLSIILFQKYTYYIVLLQWSCDLAVAGDCFVKIVVTPFHSNT